MRHNVLRVATDGRTVRSIFFFVDVRCWLCTEKTSVRITFCYIKSVGHVILKKVVKCDIRSFFSKTRQSSCGKPQKSYCLSKHNPPGRAGRGGGKVPHPDLARGVPPCLGLGYPPKKGPGISHWGTPPQERTCDQWKYYGMEMGYIPPPPPRCEQTNKLKI